MVSHGAALDDDQLQPPSVVTLTLPVPAEPAADCAVGLTLKVQAPPACVTMADCPPSEMLPLRASDDRFGSTPSVRLPLPDPDAAPVMWSHGALLVAVQAQPAVDAMPSGSAPPAAGAVCDAGDSVYAQARAVCEIVTLWPATVSDPVRGAVVGLAATLNAAAPLPVPEAPDVIVSHGLALVAVHVHPLVVATDTLPVPAALPKLVAVGVAVKAQDAPVCEIVNA